MQAVVLAGGVGRRLRPYTTVIPKPLMPIGDRAIIEVLLHQLVRRGFDSVIISLGYLGHLIQAVVGDGKGYGLNIVYVREEKPLGTAGALKMCLGTLDENFLVVNGDLLTTLDFAALMQAHSQRRPAATIGVYEREVAIDFGVVRFDDTGCLVGYDEKPRLGYEVSMGVNVLEREIVEPILAESDRIDMPDLLKALRAAGHRVHAYRGECYWLDIGRADDYEHALKVFVERRDEFLY